MIKALKIGLCVLSFPAFIVISKDSFIFFFDAKYSLIISLLNIIYSIMSYAGLLCLSFRPELLNTKIWKYFYLSLGIWYPLWAIYILGPDRGKIQAVGAFFTILYYSATHPWPIVHLLRKRNKS